MSDEQVFRTVVCLCSLRAGLAWLLTLLLIVMVYAAEEAGWPAFRSERLRHWYSQASWWMLAIAAPLCPSALMFILFVNGIKL